MEKEIKSLSLIAVLLLLYFLISFFFSGILTIPTEGDSIAYHLPIARSVLDGTVLTPSRDGYALGFYPGSAEVILSIFFLSHIPANLYNVVGWVLLVYLLIRLGKAYTLSPQLSVIYSMSAATSLAMIRLLNNQTIDIWLAVFFTGALLLLKEPKTSLRYYFYLGLSLGMLIGSKFSGPFYAAMLLLFYGRGLIAQVHARRVVVFLIPVFLFGVSWYLRNMILTGNPLYPQGIFMLPGNEQFVLMKWVGWQTLVFYPNGLSQMVWSFFSEYMFWMLAPVISLLYIIRNRNNKHKTSSDILRLTLLGISNLLVFFFLPSTPDNIITYLRYLFPSFIPFILVVFLIADRTRHLKLLLPLTLINTALLITFTAHQPKLLVIYLVLAGIVIYKYDILEKYLAKL